MSTGAECYFQEVEPGRWKYALQRWPYGEWDEYDTYGPFDSYAQAEDHLSNNHANPGGWSTGLHPQHKHDTKLIDNNNGTGRVCPACWKTP